jgi:1-acyl-sn-glycerol-3-phosphate acyltransferase
MHRFLRDVLGTAYGLLALPLFVALLVLATLAVLVVPGLERRRALVGAFARGGLVVLGVRVAVEGRERLPAGACVVAANHASYLDGVVMVAALPPRFAFVVKREASSMPVVGFLLRRIGVEFVDRHDRGGRQRDARRVVRRAEQGQALMFFPEGTFFREPGLRRFHIGAFVAAMRGEVPIVPAVIHGARRLLPSGTLLTRPGPLRLEILAPIGIEQAHGSIETLRDLTRAQIAARLDEPDLHPSHRSPAVHSHPDSPSASS